METIRVLLPEEKRNIHAPPPGFQGKFYCLEECNDLPLWHYAEWQIGRIELRGFSRQGGKIFMQNFYVPGSWKEVTIQELEAYHFSSDLIDDYEACTTSVVMKPFPPELFLVAESWKTKAMLEHEEWRIHKTKP